MAGSPTLIDGFVRLQASSLTGLEREVVGLTVSFENACTWSMAAHSTFAAAQGASEEVLEALRSGRELPDARLQALHVFTRKLLRSRGHLDADDVEALRKAGYTTEQALEVIAQAACTSRRIGPPTSRTRRSTRPSSRNAGRRWRRERASVAAAGPSVAATTHRWCGGTRRRVSVRQSWPQEVMRGWSRPRTCGG